MTMGHRWYVDLICIEGKAVMSFGHHSAATGSVVWDQEKWPVDFNAMTERQVLSELMDGALVFMERRA